MGNHSTMKRLQPQVGITHLELKSWYRRLLKREKMVEKQEKRLWRRLLTEARHTVYTANTASSTSRKRPSPPSRRSRKVSSK